LGLRRFAAKAALVILSVLLLAGPAFSALADDFPPNSKYHWGTKRIPFTLRVGDNVDSGWDKYLKRGAKRWSQSGVVKMRVTKGGVNPNTCAATRGQVEVCSADYGPKGWLGVTKIAFSGKHITQATVQLNDYYFRQSKYNNRKIRQHTMCHELGHALGLPHPKNNSKSCMNDDTDRLAETTKPLQSDFDRLLKVNDHRDRDITTRRAKAASAAGSIFDPATIPNAEVSDDGRHTVTESRLPDGSTMVTIVTWVDEADAADGVPAGVADGA
jgi:hypothetical protein